MASTGSPGGNISYDHGAMGDLSSQVGTAAASLMEIHDDVLHRTQALQEFFEGVAGVAYHDRQVQILNGLAGLIQVVVSHSHKISEASLMAHALDIQIGAGF